MRKICVVTGTRAEYGLLQGVMQGIAKACDLQLQIIATGMHLSPEFGLTYLEIEQDGFEIDLKVEMLVSSDTSVGIAKSMGLGMIGFADALNKLKPDVLLVLGDRFEILAAVSAALVARIPVAHLHGGETSEGAYDESIRHAITKMSHLHFVAAEIYRQRVLQLGENPSYVWDVGGLGVDNINRLKLMDRHELEESLDFKLGKKNLLITYHPVTLENSSVREQMHELLNALGQLTDTHLIFTFPNADAGGHVIMEMLQSFIAQHSNAKVFTSLGQLRYLSCIKHVDGVVGNSSSGLLEVPSFRKGTINIGDRQLGRLKAKSVIDCQPKAFEITAALGLLYSETFQNLLKEVSSPYGVGGASKKIVEILRFVSLDNIIKKHFYDLPGNFV